MSGDLEMTYGSISLAAHANEDAADRVRSVNLDRLTATLPPDSLGKLPQSADIQAAFESTWSGLGQALNDLTLAFEGVAQRLHGIRDLHRDADDAVADRFRRLQGGAGDGRE